MAAPLSKEIHQIWQSEGKHEGRHEDADPLV